MRHTLLKKRKEKSAEERQEAALSASAQLILDPLFDHSHSIGCYLATQHEFDCAPIIEAIWKLKKNCYLPKLISVQNKKLEFVSYSAKDKLAPNRYKILEPVGTKKIETDQLDLVIMPLLGFDSGGNRLGMGGGYYDRTFEFLGEREIKKPLLIGLAYEDQEVQEISPDVWDVPMYGVLTEKRLVIF